jgi:hypothetical protein
LCFHGKSGGGNGRPSSTGSRSYGAQKGRDPEEPRPGRLLNVRSFATASGLIERPAGELPRIL